MLGRSLYLLGGVYRCHRVLLALELRATTSNMSPGSTEVVSDADIETTCAVAEAVYFDIVDRNSSTTLPDCCMRTALSSPGQRKSDLDLVQLMANLLQFGQCLFFSCAATS